MSVIPRHVSELADYPRLTASFSYDCCAYTFGQWGADLYARPGSTRPSIVMIVKSHCTELCPKSITQLPLRNFPVDEEVADLLATSRSYNGIWETTRRNRHNGLLSEPACYRLVTDLSFMLQT